MSLGIRSNEEIHASNGSMAAQGATASSLLSSPNTNWGISTGIEPQGPPLLQHQPPTHMSPNPNNALAPSLASQAPPELQIAPYAGSFPHGNIGAPQQPQASDWANMATDPFIPSNPPHIPDSWLHSRDPLCRVLFPSDRTRLAARRNALMRARFKRSRNRNINPSAVQQYEELSPSLRLALNREFRLHRFSTNSASNGITNQTTVGPGLPPDMSFSAPPHHPPFPNIPLPATSVGDGGFEIPWPSETQNTQSLDDDDDDGDDGLDTPVRPRGRVIDTTDGAIADTGPNLMRPGLIARISSQFAPGPSGAQDTLANSSPFIPQPTGSARATLSDPFMGRNDEGDNDKPPVLTPSPPRALITDDNYDVLNRPLLDRVARQCREGGYRNTPTAIATYHQLAMADDLFYRNIFRGMFMINETLIVAYHNPGETRPLVPDRRRQDRRLMFTCIQGVDGLMCWCRVYLGRILVPALEMGSPPAEFENVVNLWQYFRDRTNIASSTEAYARLVVPENYIDRSYNAVNSNIRRLGMYPEADINTAAFRLATLDEVAAAEADAELNFLLPRDWNQSLVPESEYVNPANLTEPATYIASFLGPGGTNITSRVASPYQGGGSNGPPLPGPEGPAPQATTSLGDIDIALGLGGHDQNYLPSSSNIAGVPDAVPASGAPVAVVDAIATRDDAHMFPNGASSFESSSIISESATTLTQGHTPAPIVPATEARGNNDLDIPVEYHGTSNQLPGTSSSHTGSVGSYAGWGVGLIPAMSELTDNLTNKPDSDGNANPPGPNNPSDVPGGNSTNLHFFGTANNYPIDPLVVAEDDGLDEFINTGLFEDTPEPDNNNNNNEGGDETEEENNSGDETEQTQDTSDGA